jgi:sulfur carrier protein ThiS
VQRDLSTGSKITTNICIVILFPRLGQKWRCWIDIVNQFQLPIKLVHLVLVNGKYIKPEERDTHPLEEGDVLAIWPPVAGG